MARTQHSSKRPKPWDIAKTLLLQDYLDGRIPTNIVDKPKEVYKMRPEYADVKYENFRTNFRAMKKKIIEHKDRAVGDQSHFAHDLERYTLAKDTEDCWHRSPAQKLLKRDMEKEKHLAMKPKKLWKSRPEYQSFDLQVFRGHIHQALRAEVETNYWIVKKKKKAMREAAKSGAQRLVAEDEIDFYDPVLDM
jgi:hypothetical protein